MKSFFQKYIAEFLTALIGGFAAWFFQRKRKRVEVKAAQADNQQKIMDLYQEALDDLEERYEKRFAFLKAEQEAHFATLQTEIKNLKRNLERWKKKYQVLKQEFDEYKEQHP